MLFHFVFFNLIRKHSIPYVIFWDLLNRHPFAMRSQAGRSRRCLSDVDYHLEAALWRYMSEQRAALWRKERQKQIRGKRLVVRKSLLCKDEDLRTVRFAEGLVVFPAIQVLKSWDAHILKIQQCASAPLFLLSWMVFVLYNWTAPAAYQHSEKA